MRHMQDLQATRRATPLRPGRLRRLGQAGLATAVGLVFWLALPAAAEEAAEEAAEPAAEHAAEGPTKSGLVTSTASPRVEAPAPPPSVPAALAPPSDASHPSDAIASDAGASSDTSVGPQPPAAPDPAPVDPLFERREAEAELAAAHARLTEADQAVGVMRHRNYPRGDARAEILAEQAEAERSFHEAQAAVDHLDARDGW